MFKILCATDFSHRATQAVQKSSKIAKEINARLDLLHAVNMKFFEKLLVGKRRVELREDLKKRLRLDLINLGVDGDIYAEIGNPNEVIMDVVRLTKPDLMVLGDHGEKRLKDTFLGTTARHAIEQSHIPVLIVKSGSDIPYKKIVLATDFSQSSKIACEIAVDLFGDSHFVMLNSFLAPNRQTAKQYQIDTTEIDKMVAEIELEQKAQLEQFKNSLSKLPKQLDLITIGSSSVVDDILNACADEQADLLVMGTKGIGSIVPLTIGSVTDLMVRHSKIDMLVCKV